MNIDSGIIEFEQKIGLTAGFFKRLLEEDDWSFVIKLHALFEAACTHLLLYHFKEPELQDVFSRLELSNKSSGKVAFLERLELLNKDNRRFIASLSELRNSLVHDVRNSEFNMKAMVLGMEPNAQSQFAISFSPYDSFVRRYPFDPKMKVGFEPAMVEHASIENMVKRATTDPKTHVWYGAYNVLLSIVDTYSYSDYRQWTKAKAVFDERESD